MTWKPTPPKGYPTDYFVPNFGVDHEIVATHKHMGDAEKRLKHKWVLKKDEDDKWVAAKLVCRDLSEVQTLLEEVDSSDRIGKDQYNKEINAAVARMDAGNYVSHEDALDKLSTIII